MKLCMQVSKAENLSFLEVQIVSAIDRFYYRPFASTVCVCVCVCVVCVCCVLQWYTFGSLGQAQVSLLGKCPHFRGT